MARNPAQNTRTTRTASLATAGALAALVLALPPARAEVIEEVVARVNDDIITRSDLQDAEQQTVADLMSTKSGDELDKELVQAKSQLLRDLITKKLLVQQAERLYDTSKMQDAFIRQFKEQQKVTSNAELEKLVKNEGMTMEEFKRKLVEFNAPNSVVDYEVRDKLSVSDAEVEAWYKEHGRELASPDKVSFREIVLLAEGRSREETLALAEALVKRARSGEDFMALAKASSQVDTALRGSLLGPFTKGELAPELEGTLFAMKPGEIGEPVEVAHAVHVVRLESREESVVPPFESLKEKISTSLERAKFEVALQTFLENLWKSSEIHVKESYVERLPLDYRKYVKAL